MFDLVLRAPEALVEPVSDALIDELGALSVSVEDADAGSDAEQALFGEPGMPAPRPGWQRSTLHALFAEETDASDAAALLLAQDWTDGLALQSLQPLPDQDWVRLTQSQFDPVFVAPGFWIVPSWHEPPADAERVIRLDPGLAFGTGTHPTTRMCLRWIAAHPQRWDRVLDYGCGSGILAIAAGKLGAGTTVGVDLDEQALAAARANSAVNAVAARYTGPAGLAPGVFDIVVANILSNPLKLLAPALLARVAPGGALVLSGVLERQADEVIAAYREADAAVELRVWHAADGWVCLAGERAA